jgi:hypothetical protein
MRKVISAWFLLPFAIAALSLGDRAQAQQFYVFGSPYWNNDYNYGWPNNPNNPNFDPAAAAINALNTSFPRSRRSSSPIDFSLIDAMERGDRTALGGHTARCAARYVTYSRTTDRYIGNDGLLKRCKL